MATITEDHVGFETAKLLKEKGFDNVCSGYYNQERVLQILSACSIKDTLRSPFYFDCMPAPTLQMAMKWLREMHKIFIEISISIDLNGDYHYSYTVLDKECKYLRRGYTDFDWNYEQACEEAIKYCLEHLI